MIRRKKTCFKQRFLFVADIVSCAHDEAEGIKFKSKEIHKQKVPAPSGIHEMLNGPKKRRKSLINLIKLLVFIYPLEVVVFLCWCNLLIGLKASCLLSLLLVGHPLGQLTSAQFLIYEQYILKQSKKVSDKKIVIDKKLRYQLTSLVIETNK